MLNKNEIAGRANIFSPPDAFDISPTRYVEELIYDRFKIASFFNYFLSFANTKYKNSKRDGSIHQASIKFLEFLFKKAIWQEHKNCKNKSGYLLFNSVR